MVKKANGGKLSTTPFSSSQHNLFVIDDETINDPIVKDKVFVPTIDGQPKGHGLVPRKHSIYPPEMFASPTEVKVIPASEYDERIKAQEEMKSSLEHLMDWPSLDQNGQGYCWAYSTTAAVMAIRSQMNLSYVRLSAHAVACKIKGFRDEGGWCGLSAKFHVSTGCPSTQYWAEKSMARSNDKPEVWANGALHKVTETWIDATRDVYDVNMALAILDSLLLTNNPCAADLNWWGHSVFMGRLVKVEAGSYGRRIRNSWTDQWGERGWSTLRGSKAVPDSCLALCVVNPSAD